MLGKWFGVVEGMGNVSCVGTHVGCDATGVCVDGDDNVPCACAHVGCYATGLGCGMITFLALEHIQGLDVMQSICVGWRGGGC